MFFLKSMLEAKLQHVLWKLERIHKNLKPYGTSGR